MGTVLRAFRSELSKISGIDTEGRRYEEMDGAKWLQTAKDLPVVVLGSALGYGIGKTFADEAGRRLAQRGGVPPEWVKYVPIGTQIASSIGGYAYGRSRRLMAERREEASRRAAR